MIRINLLSDREAIQKETTRQQVSIFVLMICLVVVILGGIQFYQYRTERDLEQRTKYVNQELEELNKKVGEVEKYKKAKKELETKLQIIERLQKDKMLVVRLLDGIGETIPEKMWLQELTLKAGKLSLEGYAVDNETIATYMRRLQGTKSFGSVELAFAERKEVEGVGMKHFSLVAPLAPPKTVAKKPAAKTDTTGPVHKAK